MEGLNHSEQLNELFSALAKAQANILSAKKDSSNPFFKSKFADLSSVWEAIRKPLTDNGLSIIQTCEGVTGAMFLITWLGHSSGQWMKSRVPIAPAKADPQSLGSYITYMRRYALSAIVGVVSDEDDDGEAAMKHARIAQNKPIVGTPVIDNRKVTDEMEEALKELLMQDLEYKQKVDEFLGSKNFTSLAQLSFTDFDKLMKRAKQRQEVKNDSSEPA